MSDVNNGLTCDWRCANYCRRCVPSRCGHGLDVGQRTICLSHRHLASCNGRSFVSQLSVPMVERFSNGLIQDERLSDVFDLRDRAA